MDTEIPTKNCSATYCTKHTKKTYCKLHTCQTSKCDALAIRNNNHCIRHKCEYPKCNEQRDMNGLCILAGESPSKYMNRYCEWHKSTE
jgi:hypothetical protein